MRRTSRIALGTFLGLVFLPGSKPAFAQESLQKVKHIIIVMQENHSFDNYFGALAFAPDSPYHTPGGIDHDGHGACQEGDHSCVDGLSCMMDASGGLHCFNSNIDDGGHSVFTFHDSRRCVLPDLDHEWLGTHKEANFLHPNGALGDFRADGFVRQNDLTEQLDNGVESPTEDQTMNFYNQEEIPF
jgi:phospholipase C